MIKIIDALVIFGSKSDENVYNRILSFLDENDISYIFKICSAHRSPEFLGKVLRTKSKIIIAGAGLAAHLPGVIASKTVRPVIGVPCSGNLDGMDALLSIIQMPPGIPVLCSTINASNLSNIDLLLRGYNSVNIIGEPENKRVKACIDSMKNAGLVFSNHDNPVQGKVNITFFELDKPDTVDKNNLTINVPLKEESNAMDSLKLLEAANNGGLFVGINRGDNAAIAAVQILALTNGNLNDILLKERKQMKNKILELNKSHKDDNPDEENGGVEMFDEEIVKKQINFTLKGTDFEKLGEKYKGKVRDVYVAGDKIFLVATDRQSAFDRNLANIPFKGQVLTQTSAFWFENTKDIIPNQVISVPDPNVVVARKLKVFAVEFVVRGYITGVTSTAAWTAYSKGERNFCGNVLPEGLKKNQKFERPIITPTTKSEEHDEKISGEEVVKRWLMTQEQWNFLSEKALKLFQRGQEIAEKNGLILVDTKYEFGYDEDGNMFLVDEVHTPDSSRFWIKETYEEKFNKGEEPENIDKEFLRLWFSKNCDPYNDKELPEAPEELVVELSRKYIQLYEMITGNEFKAEAGDVSGRIEKNLKDGGFL